MSCVTTAGCWAAMFLKTHKQSVRETAYNPRAGGEITCELRVNRGQLGVDYHLEGRLCSYVVSCGSVLTAKRHGWCDHRF